MGVIALLLLERSDAGDGSLALARLAESLLGNAPLVATDAAGPAHAEAMSAFRALEVTCRNAFRRFPGPSDNPDARALALSHTLALLRDRGFYGPAELAPAGATGVPGWAEFECVRLHSLVITLKAAIRDLDSGRLDARAYAGQVEDVLHRFATMAIARDPAIGDS